MNLKFMSYNSTGLASDKCDFINEILDFYKPDLLFIQETWLLNSTLSVLSGIHNQYLANGVSAIADNELIIGRPYGGVGVLWRKSMANVVKFLSIPGTSRACACKIVTGTDEILCINVYMPNDNQSKNNVDPRFYETLDAIEVFIERCQIRNVVIAGDMNADFNRFNAHDVCLRNFAFRNDFVCSVDLNVIDKGFTYHDPANRSYSCIDHFMLSSGMTDQVLSGIRCEWSINPSKHLPIIFDIKVPQYEKSTAQYNDVVENMPISWNKVTDKDQDVYRRQLECFAQNVKMPEAAYCDDIMCTNPQHKEQIEIWCHELVECCFNADVHLPRIRMKKIHKPYWKEEVKPFRDECIWWHNVWKNNGEPRFGVLFEQKSAAKRQYMYAVRRYKRKEETLRRQKMAEAICENKARDFFQEVNRIKSRKVSPPCIDGLVNPQEIACHFADKYQTLFNSVPSETSRLNKIDQFINDNCKLCTESDRLVTKDDITKAFSNLKLHKSDGNVGLVSTHLLMSGELYKEHLAKFMTAILTHGYQPKMLLLPTITSIPKDNRKSVCDSSNYRGIALCSSLGKLLDIIMLHRYRDLLQTSDMQYAYKQKHSTAICSLVVKEVINYYLNNDSEVFSSCVDASKAFDRVQHDQLFDILIERKVPAIAIRALKDMYTRQQMRTVWNGHHSEKFHTANGVRQGGIISPVLFCAYMDKLLINLEKEGYGCWLGNTYYGAVGYADDLMLLSPTVSGLRQMLQTCESFGSTYGVKYNASKTVCVLYTRKKVSIKPTVKLCGTTLQWVDSVKHLGNTLMNTLDDSVDIRHKKGDLVQRVNTVLATLDGSEDSIIKKVFNSQCVHLYGATTWNFNNKAFKEFTVTWNRCVRRVFQLPPMTHTRYLPHLVGTAGVADQIYARFLRMLDTMMKSKNCRVQRLSNLCLHSPKSIIRCNLAVIQKRLNMSLCQVLSTGANVLKKVYIREASPQDNLVIGLINELRAVMKQHYFINGFYTDEIKDMLFFTCVY